MDRSALQVGDGASLRAHVPRLLLAWGESWGEAQVVRVNASLLLLDVWGFTKLAERLAETGKSGAEEASALINASFADFLTIADEDDGALIKFGGDALLLVFDGADHERRACRAAARMVEVGRLGARPATSVGPVNLRIRVGVSSGEMVLVLAGRSHRELVVVGPAAGLVSDLERVARPGEVVVAPATAAALDPSVLGEWRGRGRGRVLIAEPSGPPLTGPADVGSGVDAGLFVPAGLRGALSTGQVDGEHRQAAVAFLRFGPVNRRIVSDGAEAVAADIDRLICTVQDAAVEHGICFRQCDIAADGGVIFLVAGVPRTTGHDDESMIAALRRIVDSSPSVRLRVGVARGRVFAGEIGTVQRRTYAVIGDVVNVAARLSARARPGQILAGQQTLDRCKTAYTLSPVAPLRLRGRTEPVDTVLIGEAAPLQRRAIASGRVLLGRNTEVASLRAALDRACKGHGGVVQLIGDPGMGKSRLLEELRRLADQRMAILAVSCTPYEAATPYFVARTLLGYLLPVLPAADPMITNERLRRAVAAVDPELTPWLPLIAACLNVDVPSTPQVDRLDRRYRRAKLHVTVARLLNRLLPRPALLALEDAHWMDEASAALLQHLCRSITGGPWLLCVTRRPGDDGLSVQSERRTDIPLRGLDDHCTSELVQSLAPQLALSAVEAHRLAARAGGNPLFLRELVREEIDRRDEGQLPDSVEAVLTARLDRLSGGDRRLLQYASVLGAQFSKASLARILPEAAGVVDDPDLSERLAEFVTTDAGGSHTFRHELFRDVAYEGLSYARRRELHERAARIHEEAWAGQTHEIAELLSLHFSRAQVSDKTWEYSLVAAERARSKGGNVEAVSFYRRALAAAAELPSVARADVARVSEALGDVADLAGRYDDAAHGYAHARRIVGSRGARARLLYKEGLVLERTGRYGEALRLLDRGLMAAERLPCAEDRTRQRMELRLAIAGVHHRRGRQVSCVQWARLAERDAMTIADRGGCAHAYSLLHLAFTSLGHPNAAQYRELALPVLEELGDQVRLGGALNNLGMDAYFHGDWEGSLDYYRRAMEARERAGDVAGRAVGWNNIAEICADQGHFEEADRLFLRSRAVSSSIGYAILAAVAGGNLGRTAARTGRLREAEALLGESVAEMRRLDARQYALEMRTRQAELAVFATDPLRALALADAVLADATTEVSAVLTAFVHRVRGWALAQRGELEAAAAALATSASDARRVGAPYELALTEWSAAAVDRAAGRRDRVADLDRRATDALTALGVVAVPAVPGVRDAWSRVA